MCVWSGAYWRRRWGRTRQRRTFSGEWGRSAGKNADDGSVYALRTHTHTLVSHARRMWMRGAGNGRMQGLSVSGGAAEARGRERHTSERTKSERGGHNLPLLFILPLRAHTSSRYPPSCWPTWPARPAAEPPPPRLRYALILERERVWMCERAPGCKSGADRQRRPSLSHALTQQLSHTGPHPCRGRDHAFHDDRRLAGGRRRRQRCRPPAPVGDQLARRV